MAPRRGVSQLHLPISNWDNVSLASYFIRSPFSVQLQYTNFKMVQETAQEPLLGGLQFNEPLSWRAGKPIPTGTLLQRLDSLSNELRDMDQEETDKDSLTSVAKELVAPNLLNHKDKGVRAFVACCLVDVLKICAPDAPFTGSQLRVCFASRFQNIQLTVF